ncbi:hypothetical protein [uncultured Aquimarina sp.]|uniref:hypothetical protein n=1 Tax=uncultured Aquimarina sp. TaxID=575652 RepID=UPI0026076D09|nr:hypothetical protein [uncultured Aquimarina sp.]
MEINKIKQFLFVPLIFIILMTSCNKDIENVRLEGYVYDIETKTPLSGITLKIENAYYEGGDYDSYNHYNSYQIITDEKGYFKVDFKKSAYIQIDVVQDGYEKFFRAIEVYTNDLKEEIFLEKN